MRMMSLVRDREFPDVDFVEMTFFRSTPQVPSVVFRSIRISRAPFEREELLLIVRDR